MLGRSTRHVLGRKGVMLKVMLMSRRLLLGRMAAVRRGCLSLLPWSAQRAAAGRILRSFSVSGLVFIGCRNKGEKSKMEDGRRFSRRSNDSRSGAMKAVSQIRPA